MPYLHQALSSTRWPARMQAMHVLSKMGRYEDADRLVPLIGDEVDAVASHAYWAAAQTHNPSVVPALVGQLSRGDSEHRNSLTVALAEFGEAAVPVLVDALRSGPSADVRRHAADTLSLMGSPSADRAALPLAEAALAHPQIPRAVRFTELLREVSRTHSGHPQSRGRSLAGRGLSWRHGDPATH